MSVTYVTPKDHGKDSHDFAFTVDRSLMSNSAALRHQLRHGKLNKMFARHNLDTLLLLITEVITNINRHAHDKGNHMVIRIFHDTNDLFFLDIADNSTPFSDFTSHSQQSQKRLENKTMRENGYGLGIMQQLSPSVSYTPSNKSDDNLNHMIFDITHIVSANSKPCIYIIDDDMAMCTLLELYLKDTFCIRIFQHAKLALEAMRTEKPDLIISDLHMPEFNGIQFRQRLNDNEEYATIPFIFLSGNKAAATSEYLTPLGIDDYLCKPIKKDVLISVCSRLIERSHQIMSKHVQKVGRDITAILEPDLPQTIGEKNEWQADIFHHNAEIGGGDFVLHFPVSDGDLIVLADAMGKGIQAKFFACAYAGYFRSFFKMAARIDSNPASILGHFSDSILNDPIFRDIIVTVQIVLLEPDGTATISSAGHPQPHYYNSFEQKAEPVDIRGPLPALSNSPVYQSQKVICKNDDILVFHTDGLGESANRSAIIEQTVSDNRKTELAQWLYNGYDADNDAPYNDDKTLITLTYNP